MYNAQLGKLIADAVSRLQSNMAEHAPVMARQVSGWMQRLAGKAQPEHYFMHPQAFPSLLLPWWLEQSLGLGADLPLQANLAYSTINGYYAIRLMDNLMDGQATVELKLLPALNFFQSQFQAAYYPYFPANHPFWTFFHHTWTHSADVTVQDAILTDLDADQFEQVAAQKTCAAKIPLAAVCYHYNRPDLLQSWSRWVDLFGCWHQLLNDCFGWHRDDASQAHTYFLAEAGRRREPDELVVSWVAREGFAWAIDKSEGWMSALKELAKEMDSPDLSAYLETRETLLSRQVREISEGLKTLGKIAMLSR